MDVGVSTQGKWVKTEVSVIRLRIDIRVYERRMRRSWAILTKASADG